MLFRSSARAAESGLAEVVAKTATEKDAPPAAEKPIETTSEAMTETEPVAETATGSIPAETEAKKDASPAKSSGAA